MKLYLVRHGESEFNRIGEEAGSDSPLSELGWQQAEQLGRWLRDHGPFHAFYSSPLKRALQTAEVLSQHIDAPPPIVLDTLRESDFHLIDVLPQYDDPLKPILHPGEPAFPDSYQRFRGQVETALRTIVSDGIVNGHQKILVVAHGGTLGTIVRTLVGCHRISVWSQNCCVHCLAWTDQRWEIRFMNRIDFLEYSRSRE